MTHPFNLPASRAAKADPALIGADERHFAAVAAAHERRIAELTRRLDAARKAPGGKGQAALDRDLEIHRLSARLRLLHRFGRDLCLGRMVRADETDPVYLGRLGLTDAAGRRLLVDWRAPAAEPYFAATHANPMGLVSRRRYRWIGGQVSDYWDEVFTPEGLEGHAALDDQSAFIASLGDRRTPRMRDVLATIQADQDAIIRAGSRGALVVDGGPGTGKTVVALHRAAYLVYADPRVGEHHGGVLFVGPHDPYLAYVADVLPSLGEEGVRTCTLRDLVPEGGAATAEEPDPLVARLKSSGRLIDAIEPAVAFYEEAPTTSLTVASDWSEVVLTPADWAECLAAPEPGTPHNEAREDIRTALLELLIERHEPVDGVTERMLRRSLERDADFADALNRAWPVIEAGDLVGDLWSVPAYLRRCAPWLTADEIRALQRADAQAWTANDLPLLDAARRRLGDPRASARTRAHEAAVSAQREVMDHVVEHLIAADDDGEGLVTSLRQADLRDALVDGDAGPRASPDALAGPFAHVVVDEAQELTDAQWRMLLDRCPSRSFTIVGDRAQARHGFTPSWPERLRRVGMTDVTVATLRVNYRTPAQIMAQAEPIIRAAVPDANVPTSIRTGGPPVVHASRSQRDPIIEAWLATHADGVACVIGDPAYDGRPRVRSLPPELAKGLEFDLVVLVDAGAFEPGIEGAVDRYVAMTRATGQLVILTAH